MAIAAFFDLDGTLLPPPTLERSYLSYLAWRRERGATSLEVATRWLAAFLRRFWHDMRAATAGNKAHLAGIRAATVEAWQAWFAGQPTALFPEGLARLHWHAAQGHPIFLVSGTLRPLAEAVARKLPMSVMVSATELECVGGRWTGRILGEAISGPAKARAMECRAERLGLDLRRSYAYGDRYADRWMLDRVGYPAAVNPTWRLYRLARRRRWPVFEWRTTHDFRREARPCHT